MESKMFKRREEVNQLYGTMSITEIAEELGVTRATIHNDINWLASREMDEATKERIYFRNRKLSKKIQESMKELLNNKNSFVRIGAARTLQKEVENEAKIPQELSIIKYPQKSPVVQQDIKFTQQNNFMQRFEQVRQEIIDENKEQKEEKIKSLA